MKTILPGGPAKREIALRLSSLFREAYARKLRFARRDHLKAVIQKDLKRQQQVKATVEDLVATVCANENDDSSSTVASECKSKPH